MSVISFLERKATNLANSSLVTGTNLATERLVTGLPQDVRGLKIMGIGEGISSVTKELCDLGAEAFAIDCRYDNENRLKKSLHQYGASEDIQEAFFQDFRVHPERYIPALVGAHKLPFEDNSIDFVYSSKCLTTILLEDLEVFTSAFREIVRVLKHYQRPMSGIFMMAPWLGGISMSEVNPVNALAFIDYLKTQNDVVASVAQPQIQHLPTRLLVIKK